MSNVKKTISIDIILIEVLKKYSSKTKSLTSQLIADKVNQEYDLKVDKKTVKRHLDKLSKVEDSEYGSIKKVDLANGGKFGWYIDKNFSDSEILTMILSLYAAKNLSLTQTNQLINKLCKFSNDNFKKTIGLDNKNTIVQFKTTENKDFYDLMGIIMQAIENKKIITFEYQKYDINCKLKKILDENNKTKVYKVFPYKLIVYNGRYYLHCNYIHDDNKKTEDLRNFRVDRMDKIFILDEPYPFNIKKISTTDVIEYTSKHVFMYGDDPVSCVVKIKKDNISEFIDWFGSYFNKGQETDDYYTVKLSSSYIGMKVWALQHLEVAEVVEPKKLRDEIKSSLKKSMNIYK